MPEGHTLYRVARDLDGAFAGGTPRVTSPQGRFADGAATLDGRRLIRATSRGKHLFVEFGGDAWLNVHLGLIGSFTIDASSYVGEVPVVGQVRLRLATDRHVADLRGPTVCQVVTPDYVDGVLARLGPDPLRAGDDAFQDPERAWSRIHRSTRPVGELLMDQGVLAGVGNVYRSEVLFRARVNPFTPGTSLKRHTWEAVWADLVRLMPLGAATGRIVTVPEQVAEVERALAAGELVVLAERTSAVYRRAGEPCPHCGSRVRTMVLAGRNLFWCGRCQRRG